MQNQRWKLKLKNSFFRNKIENALIANCYLHIAKFPYCVLKKDKFYRAKARHFDWRFFECAQKMMLSST